MNFLSDTRQISFSLWSTLPTVKWVIRAEDLLLCETSSLMIKQLTVITKWLEGEILIKPYSASEAFFFFFARMKGL